MDLQLRDTVAMVVGATGGIGSAVAEAFAAEGSKLALVGRDEAKLAKLAEQLGRYDVERATFTCDLETRPRREPASVRPSSASAASTCLPSAPATPNGAASMLLLMPTSRAPSRSS
jgi:short-subunit dehydrogenase